MAPLTQSPQLESNASMLSGAASSSPEEELRSSFIALVNQVLGGERTSSFSERPDESEFLLAQDKAIDAPALAESTIIGGRFTVKKTLGQGGFGVVYLAHDKTLDREVALKVPHEKLRKDPQLSSQCLKEARLAAKLKHPSIVTIFDINEDEGQIGYIVQEYISGATLQKAMSQRPLSIRETLHIIKNVAEAIQFAHTKGVYHRDLKPANLILDQSGGIRVLDFGLAVDEEMQRGARGQVAGTLAYMSPEQIEGRTHHLDGRTDIWSLGVIFYELLTGRRPFRGTTVEVTEQILHREAPPPRQFLPAIPKKVEACCLKCLSKSISIRYSTALDLLEELKEIVETEVLPDELPSGPLPALPQHDTKKLGKDKTKDIRNSSSAKNWIWWTAGAAAAIVVVVLSTNATISIYSWTSPRRSPWVDPRSIPMPIPLEVRNDVDLVTKSSISMLFSPKDSGQTFRRKELGIELIAGNGAAIQFDKDIACENYTLRMELSAIPKWNGAFFILIGINDSKNTPNYSVSHFIKLFQRVSDGKWYMTHGYAAFDRSDLIQEYEIRKCPLIAKPEFSQLIEIDVRNSRLTRVNIAGHDYLDIALSDMTKRLHLDSFERQHGIRTDSIQGRVGLMWIDADLALNRAILLEYYPAKP